MGKFGLAEYTFSVGLNENKCKDLIWKLIHSRCGLVWGKSGLVEYTPNEGFSLGSELQAIVLEDYWVQVWILIGENPDRLNMHTRRGVITGKKM